jgi:hypothetical protein
MKCTGILWLMMTAIAVSGLAQEKAEKPEEAKPADPRLIFQADFEEQEPGGVPGSYLVLDGEWSIAELDGGRVLKLAEDPLVEASVQFGDSLKTGGTIKARIKTDRNRRSYPRFGVGLHGRSGFNVRMVPVEKKMILYKGGIDSPVQSAACDWRAGEWYFIELRVEEAGDAWTVSARAWAESDNRPKQAQIEYIATDVTLSGKGSAIGTPFSGQPIYFDDIEVRLGEAGVAGKKGE